MRSSIEASSSPLSRSKKPNLRSSKNTQSIDQIPLSSKTPELTRHTTRRTRNRGFALSVSDVRKVAESLQNRDKPETTPFSGSARRKLLPSSPRKPEKTSAVKLHQEYEIFEEFFNSLVSSIQLLRMKGSKTSFSNIKEQIKCLTDRRFTHGNLAQLKFLFPEAIEIKKVLVFDERTSCMRPDLHVTINRDAVESDSKSASDCGGTLLRKSFHSRLIEFCKSNPKGTEIPEEILPEPFNRPKQDQPSAISTRSSTIFTTDTLSCSDAAPTSDNTEVTNEEDGLSVPVRTSIESLNQQPAVASHMSKSFKRRFSVKPKENVADIAQKKFSSDSLQPPVSEKEPISLSAEVVSSEVCPTICASSDVPSEIPSKNIDYSENKDMYLNSISAVSTPAKIVSTPAKIISTPAKIVSTPAKIVSTPSKLVSTPVRLMSATPALPSPKRPFMNPDDHSSSSPNKLARRPPRTRSLKFDTPVKNKETENEYEDSGLSLDDIHDISPKNKGTDNGYEDGGLSIDDDVYDILPKNLLDSIREKEIKAMEERNPAISEAKRRQKMIASLPKLFNMIHLIFQSMSRSVITKEELVCKIITGHCDIVDRREVEEQLNLLLELAPEWISEKLASSGDFIFCINKMVDAKAIRTSLEEAK